VEMELLWVFFYCLFLCVIFCFKDYKSYSPGAAFRGSVRVRSLLLAMQCSPGEKFIPIILPCRWLVSSMIWCYFWQQIIYTVNLARSIQMYEYIFL
jgi:hypothetical protein